MVLWVGYCIIQLEVAHVLANLAQDECDQATLTQARGAGAAGGRAGGGRRALPPPVAMALKALDEDSDLDETLKVDPLSAAEGAILGRLRQHGTDIAALRDGLERLQAPGASLQDLRQLGEDMTALQARVGMPENLLTKDVLLQAGIPVEGLEQVRNVCAAVQACENAAVDARACLSKSRPTPGAGAAQALERALTTWGDLRQLDARLRLYPTSVLANADIGMDRRRNAMTSLCAALVDKVAETQGSVQLPDKAKLELEALGLELPTASGARPSRGAGSRSPSSRGARSCSPAPVAAARQRAGLGPRNGLSSRNSSLPSSSPKSKSCWTNPIRCSLPKCRPSSTPPATTRTVRFIGLWRLTRQR